MNQSFVGCVGVVNMCHCPGQLYLTSLARPLSSVKMTNFFAEFYPDLFVPLFYKTFHLMVFDEIKRINM